ncbi:MAG TPA: phytanoyl-CoA dioxygenase family protein [Nocardioidaceae bacterium]|nr:phytanoyl-CoA dioxygenase family protein [Nocardioidaceae bacterium]
MSTNTRTSQGERDAFKSDGFVKVERLIDAAQTAALQGDYDRVLAGDIYVPEMDGERKPGLQVQLNNPSQHVPGWSDHPYLTAATAVAAELLDADVEFYYDQMIFKPSHYPATTDWHQDAAYWDHETGGRAGVTCWLALSDTFVDNGCLQFIPGSHLEQVRQHESIADRAEIAEALGVLELDTSTAVAVPLSAGGASFHHSRTLHYAGGNASDVPRRGLITHFLAK